MDDFWQRQHRIDADIRALQLRVSLNDLNASVNDLKASMKASLQAAVASQLQLDSICVMMESAFGLQIEDDSAQKFKNSVDAHGACKVFDENHETIEELKDEREELTAAKVDTGPENLAHYVFDEMFQPVPVSPKSDVSSFGKSEMPPLPLKSGAQLMNKDEESFPSNMEARDVVAATATGNKIKINSCQNKINSVEGKLEMKSSVHSPGGITYEKSVDPANATPTMFHRSTEPIPTDSQTFPEKFISFSAIEEAEFSSNETGNQWMEKPAVICPSKLDVPKVAYHVFDESTEPVPTGLQSSFSLYKSLEAIFISNEAGNYLYNEEGQLQSLKREGSIKHHSGNDGYEPLSEVILVVFDPGGSSLYRMGCHSFNIEDDTIRVGRLQSRDLSWKEGLNESVSLSLAEVSKNTKPCTTTLHIGMGQRCCEFSVMGNFDFSLTPVMLLDEGRAKTPLIPSDKTFNSVTIHEPYEEAVLFMRSQQEQPAILNFGAIQLQWMSCHTITNQKYYELPFVSMKHFTWDPGIHVRHLLCQVGAQENESNKRKDFGNNSVLMIKVFYLHRNAEFPDFQWILEDNDVLTITSSASKCTAAPHTSDSAIDVEDCLFILVVANFVWDPGLCVIFMHTILGDKDVFEGKEERWEAKKIMRDDKGLSRLSRDNKVVIMRRNEEPKMKSLSQPLEKKSLSQPLHIFVIEEELKPTIAYFCYFFCFRFFSFIEICLYFVSFPFP